MPPKATPFRRTTADITEVYDIRTNRTIPSGVLRLSPNNPNYVPPEFRRYRTVPITRPQTAPRLQVDITSLSRPEVDKKQIVKVIRDNMTNPPVYVDRVKDGEFVRNQSGEVAQTYLGQASKESLLAFLGTYLDRLRESGERRQMLGEDVSSRLVREGERLFEEDEGGEDQPMLTPPSHQSPSPLLEFGDYGEVGSPSMIDPFGDLPPLTLEGYGGSGPVAPQSPRIQGDILRDQALAAQLQTASVVEDSRQSDQIRAGLDPTARSIYDQQRELLRQQQRVLPNLYQRLTEGFLSLPSEVRSVPASGSLFGLEDVEEITPKTLADRAMKMSQPERSKFLLDLTPGDRGAVLENMPPAERSRFRNIYDQFRVKAEQFGLVGQPSWEMNPVTKKMEKTGPPLTEADGAFVTERARQAWIQQKTDEDYSKPPAAFMSSLFGPRPALRPPRPASPPPAQEEPEGGVEETKGSGVRSFYAKGRRRQYSRLR